MRGMIVGEVRGQLRRRRARLELALDPSQVGSIPANVTARILPKTLFGEKYVELVIAERRVAGAGIAAGDVIRQDRRVAIEVEQVLNDQLSVVAQAYGRCS